MLSNTIQLYIITNPNNYSNEFISIIIIRFVCNCQKNVVWVRLKITKIPKIIE